MQTSNLELAQRVLKIIEHHGHPSQADALALRLWAGTDYRLRPLEQIAKKIFKDNQTDRYPMGRKI